MQTHLRLSLAAIPILVTVLSLVPGGAEGTETARVRVARLIELLGSADFAVREEAQVALEEEGLVAFDDLLEATRHRDVEIALRARYLVRKMPVKWARDEDPEDVKSILRNYVHTSREERRNRMQQLASLPDSSGVEALCRLMRYESDGELSKEAALAAMNHLAPSEATAAKALADEIKQALGVSRRTGATWLRTYADTLVDPDSTIEAWNRIARTEQATFAQFPQRTNRLLLKELLRWQADLLLGLGKTEAALAIVHRTFDLVDNRRDEIFDIVDWSLEHEAWLVVESIADRFPAEFQKYAMLRYRLAEARLRNGDQAGAERAATEALAMRPQEPDTHFLMADYLIGRALFEWAEAEYRFVIKTTKPSTTDGLHMDSRIHLSLMLFDLGRPGPAADVLQAAAKTLEENPKYLYPTTRTPADFLGTMHYYYAMHYGELKNYAKQIEHLKQALEQDSSHVDYVIASFRVPEASEEWERETRDRLQELVHDISERVGGLEKDWENPAAADNRRDTSELLASSCNELAWLIANTEGDFKYALKLSLRSLEIRPEAPEYLDTLAHCYFALQDYEKAVEAQREAARLAPSYQQIQRQLEVFEEALEEHRKKAA